jgi:hypothetical protein
MDSAEEHDPSEREQRLVNAEVARTDREEQREKQETMPEQRREADEHHASAGSADATRRARLQEAISISHQLREKMETLRADTTAAINRCKKIRDGK